jgi:hypothetical protein
VGNGARTHPGAADNPISLSSPLEDNNGGGSCNAFKIKNLADRLFSCRRSTDVVKDGKKRPALAEDAE